MRYALMFIETENFWQYTGGRSVHRGGRWDVRKSVEFETDSLYTAKAIAIGFGNFFTDTTFPVSDWRKFNHWTIANTQKFPTYDETGFMESQLRFEIRLICFDKYHEHKRDQKASTP